MTPYLFKLKVGDKVSMAKHPGKDIEALRGKGVLLLAGGSGIAPMVQLLHEISRKPDFEIKSLTLVFSGINETDLYVREKLHAIQEKLGDKLKTYYLVLNPSEQWTGLKGFVMARYIKRAACPHSNLVFLDVADTPTRL
jgi:cytochrome-b5 reductase